MGYPFLWEETTGMCWRIYDMAERLMYAYDYANQTLVDRNAKSIIADTNSAAAHQWLHYHHSLIS
jgi:hypothetical protein